MYNIDHLFSNPFIEHNGQVVSSFGRHIEMKFLDRNILQFCLLGVVNYVSGLVLNEIRCIAGLNRITFMGHIFPPPHVIVIVI